ncbi:MAG: NTPase [Proteobacteria bacterium]|nr:NTPase [Pseudomonadota bacterium]
MKKNIFITGLPGVGKTTLIQKVLSQIPSDISCSGFFTNELRESGIRVGFGITTLTGQKGILSHKNFRTKQRVGRYGVDVAGFENLILPLLHSERTRIYVIDEIGKMECFSKKFCQKMAELLDSDTPVFGSIALKGKGFIREVKSRSDVEIVEVTPKNRDGLVTTLVQRIMKIL